MKDTKDTKPASRFLQHADLRPRGFSMSSIRSQAISGDEGEAPSDESMSEEDVWLPVLEPGDPPHNNKAAEADVEANKPAPSARADSIDNLSVSGHSISAQSCGRISVGAASIEETPQRFSFFAAGLGSTVHATDLASLAGSSGSFTSLFNTSNGAWFLDCFRPTEDEMRALMRAFGIHPLTAEDIQTKETREKFEKFKDYYFIVYNTFRGGTEPVNFYVVVLEEGVISFHFEPVTHCRNVRRRMRQLSDYVAFSPDWIAYALLDDITDSFAPEIKHVEKEADFIEDAVYLDHEGKVEMPTLLRRIGEGRQHTMRLLRMLSGKTDVIRGFVKRMDERKPNDMSLYLGDVLDHIVTMYQNLSAYEKIFGRTHFNYMGLLQMEFVDATNRMTSVLGKVTILGTVLLPMNLVTGLWGMNVKVPGQGDGESKWFFIILGSILLVVVSLFTCGWLYFRRMVYHHSLPRVPHY